MKKSIAAYGVIAHNDCFYTLEYMMEVNEGSRSTGRLQGYNIDVFRDAPPDLPVMDWRQGDQDAVFKFALHSYPPKEVAASLFPNRQPTMQEYFEKAKQAGCIIRTVQECYVMSTDKRFERSF
jgi:hypothetical protein